MRVTVLGKSPSWQDAGGACSGYLVQEQGFTLLLDCGNGVFAKLREAIEDYTAVDAVLVSHLHADHFFDVVPFSYALNVGPRAGSARPQLHVPPGAADCFRRVGGCLGDEALIADAFAIAEYDPAATLRVGPFTVRLREVPHFVLTHAVQLTTDAGARFTFGADCAPNEALGQLAAGSDLLMVEATTLQAPPAGALRGHLTAREAGEIGRAAGAGRLLVTHFSDELDGQRVRAEAAAGYGAPVELAREGAVHEL
jgi:ribonuclease BN (tRNA processing enzyme)